MCNISDRFKEDEKYFDKTKFYDLKEKLFPKKKILYIYKKNWQLFIYAKILCNDYFGSITLIIKMKLFDSAA